MAKKPYKVRVTIKEVTKGECAQGFKPGQTWLIEDGKTPGGMCQSAWNAVSSAVRGFRYGAEYPWNEDKNVTLVSCPDPEHWVIYEVRRIRK